MRFHGFWDSPESFLAAIGAVISLTGALKISQRKLRELVV